MIKNNKRRKQGLLITFEGCDRAGKSTQIELLNIMFNNNGHHCVKMAFPCYDTAIGSLIKDKLKNGGDPAEMHLLFVANRHEFQQKIKDHLANGINVLCDRYKNSGLVYGLAEGLSDKWLTKCDVINIDPDYIIYIDVDPEIAACRADYGNDCTYERVPFQKIVREQYLKLISNNWIVIDGNNPDPHEVHEDICDAVKFYFESSLV